jgi:hypothetical protein
MPLLGALLTSALPSWPSDPLLQHYYALRIPASYCRRHGCERMRRFDLLPGAGFGK